MPIVIESMLKTDHLPVLWLIVDDGSTDNTLKIIKEASRVHSFIDYISLSQTGGRDLTYNYSRGCKLGFERLIALAESRVLNWDYIALLDADIILSRKYFGVLITDMEKDHHIGIESGEIFSYADKKVKRVMVFDETPRGGARIWSRECFTKTGGYIISQSPDSVATAKANILGWKTKKNGDVIAYELRKTSSAEGLWKGYMNIGMAVYYVNHNPVLVLLKALTISVSRNPLLIIPYLSGYIISIVRKDPKIDDESVKQYFWYTRFIHRVRNLKDIRKLLA